jgi:hypothetical protein
MAKGFVSDLGTYVRAGYPIVNIISSEEDRALELIDELLRRKEMWKRPRKLLVWSVSRGFTDPQGRPAAKEGTRDPVQANSARFHGDSAFWVSASCGRVTIAALYRGTQQ